MKPLLWSAAAFLIMVPGLRADPSAAADLLPNPDFSLPGNDPAWPDGWGSRPTDPKQWVAESGAHYVHLELPAPGKLEMLYREIKLKPGEIKGLALTVRTRAAEAGPGDGRLLLVFLDQADRLLSGSAGPLVFPAGKGWADSSEKIQVPEGAAHLTVMAGLPGTAAGAVDIALLSCIPLDSDAAAQLPSPPVPPPMASPLLSNGDFEDADATGKWPADWSAPEPGMSWETEEGKHFVRLISQHPGETLMLNRTVPLPDGLRGLELAVHWRATGVQHGEHEWFDTRTIVHFLDRDGNILPNSGSSLDLIFTHKPAPTGWIEHAQFLAVPAGAAQLQLRPGFFQAAAGTLDLASVAVIPLDNGQASLLEMAGESYGAWKGDQNAEMERRMDGKIAAQLAATGNLMPNGNFTEATHDSAWPDGWGNGPSDGVSWGNDSGKRFIRLTANDPEKVQMLYKMVVLPLGLKAIDISFRYRTAGVVKGEQAPGDARVALHFFNGTRFGHLESGKELSPEPDPLILSPQTEGWTEVHDQLAVPEGATKLQWMPGLWYVRAGTLDLADIKIAPGGDGAPGNSQPAPQP